MKKRCNSCGRVMDHVVGPAQLDDGTLFVLIVDRCESCGNNIVEEKIPILGICLGMQLLSSGSEEGVLSGLNWIESDTLRFQINSEHNLRIPHMGWNTIRIEQDSCLFEGMYEEPRFYFVHSFYVKCHNVENVLATTDYGINFTSSVVCDNIYGVQFHPEKSHKYGMKVLGNYAELC